MTHDELLKEIDFLPLDGLHAWMQPALRAVVELHKPWNNGDEDICQECANLIDPWNENCYPCSTIQAIEKELQ